MTSALSIQAQRGVPKIDAPIKVCEEFWSEFILIAQYLHRIDDNAEIVDVFDWLRLKDLGGQAFSAALLKRVDREVATDCANEYSRAYSRG